MLIDVEQNRIELDRPVVMGIVNVTPDSFYAGSRTLDQAQLEVRVERALREGAAILDVGGYSSRPGAADVSPQEEIRRLSQGLAAIRRVDTRIPVSIDTFRGAVVRAVVERFGKCIVNDISAGELDPAMVPTVSEFDLPYIAMHMRGTPQDMNTRSGYTEITSELLTYFKKRIAALEEAGVRTIILDPGFGFAKTTAQNYELLGSFACFQQLHKPILAGVSRKSMIFNVLNVSPGEALTGTTALHWECLRQGARILRVHDVREACEVITLFDYFQQHTMLDFGSMESV